MMGDPPGRSLPGRILAAAERERLHVQGLVVLACIAMLVRYAASLHGYSGYNKPPMYGDYEAQRHWMEITLHLPASDWYRNTTDNDLRYWGLDYPPLSAYLSWVCGYLGSFVNTDWFALHTSRGIEDEGSRLFMRTTVMVCDALLFFPAVWLFVRTHYAKQSWAKQALAAIWIVLLPGLVLIDHGHFQYNNVSLGLTLLAVACVLRGRDCLASALFCLALNFKHMSLYYAPAFFFYLLGRCIEAGRPRGVARLLAIGTTVVLTFLACWLPFLGSLESAGHVLRRLFPFERGLFEDKVANFWCSANVVVKLRTLLSQEALVRLSTITTLAALLPTGIDLLRRPTTDRFLNALAASSLAFFLFSYQVHEKAILLVLLPVAIDVLRRPLVAAWFSTVATFSMYPLMQKDELEVPYACVLALHIALSVAVVREQREAPWKLQFYAMLLSAGGMLSLHVFALVFPPPVRYPDIHAVLISGWAFANFAAFFLWLNWRQLHFSRPLDKRKGQ